VGLSDRKVKLRCPLSAREVEWDRFCYFVEDTDDIRGRIPAIEAGIIRKEHMTTVGDAPESQAT